MVRHGSTFDFGAGATYTITADAVPAQAADTDHGGIIRLSLKSESRGADAATTPHCFLSELNGHQTPGGGMTHVLAGSLLIDAANK